VAAALSPAVKKRSRREVVDDVRAVQRAVPPALDEHDRAPAARARRDDGQRVDDPAGHVAVRLGQVDPALQVALERARIKQAGQTGAGDRKHLPEVAHRRERHLTEQERAHDAPAGDLPPGFDAAGSGLLGAEVAAGGAIGGVDRPHAGAEEHRRALAQPLQLGPEHRQRPGLVRAAGAAPGQDKPDPLPFRHRPPLSAGRGAELSRARQADLYGHRRAA